ALGDRERTIRARGRTLVAEAPVRMGDAARRAMIDAALRLGRALRLAGVGTVEFALDARDRIGLLRLKPRLDAGHALTETTTGVDVAKAQFRAAAGETLGALARPLAASGHAIECRIRAAESAD